MIRGIRICVLLLALTGLMTLAACGAKMYNFSVPDREVSRDLAEIPQDLEFFAQRIGPDVQLLSVAEAEAAQSHTLERFYAPWHMSRTGQDVKNAMWARWALEPERGFDANLRLYDKQRWAAILDNTDYESYPNRALKAITVDRCDLRLLPTAAPYFFNPAKAGQGYPFDYLQNSSLPIASPVFITHVSKDGRWALLESGSAGGWVEVSRLALVSNEFIRDWQSLPLAAVLRENTPLLAAWWGRGELPDGARDGGLPPIVHQADLGTLLPLVSYSPTRGKTVVRFPVRGSDGFAVLRETELPDAYAKPWPLPLSVGALAALGNQMMGQVYGWGGYGWNRDCSATMRDLFLPFGLWLPRNSKSQAKQGEVHDLSALKPRDREQFILKNGTPFLSMVGMPGHIGLYLGEHKGRAVMFHNVWGLRTTDPARPEGEGRAIIGKAVITTLTPGVERRDIATPNSLLDRVNSVNTPGRIKQE